ncbi:MAG: NADP-dependent phosphogluconate dehydrogenase, partial [Ferruginibacter sp.]|nr:NADP-dependent phosphogluconate dehydrogenase [Ferruginibacter sp.]
MESTYQFGMVGLGTMGRNLVYNMADNGFTVAGYDRDQKQVDHFTEEAGDKKIKGFSNLQEFINSLALP